MRIKYHLSDECMVENVFVWPIDNNVTIKYAIGNAGYIIHVLFLFCIKDVLTIWYKRGIMHKRQNTKHVLFSFIFITSD